MRRALMVPGLMAALCSAGCGEDSGDAATRSDRLVDFSQRPPFVNSLERDPRNGEFLLTTGLGVGDEATTQRAYVRRGPPWAPSSS